MAQYKSKYYDPVKAHDYYMKHRKLKGRKKNTRTSTAGLSEAGLIAAKEVKEQIDAEMKAALKKVKKGDKAERERIKAAFQEKYAQELDKIREDPEMVKQSGSSKKSGSSAKSEKSSSKSSDSSPKSSGNNKKSRTKDVIQKIRINIPNLTEAQRKQIETLVMAMIQEMSRKKGR